MSSEARIEPANLAVDVPEAFLRTVVESMTLGAYNALRLDQTGATEIAEAAATYGVDGEGQAHVVEAAIFSANKAKSSQIRSRIAQTVGMMNDIRGYYRPDEYGLRLVGHERLKVDDLKVVGKPSVTLSVDIGQQAKAVKLRVVAPILSRMATSGDGFDYPTSASTTSPLHSFWDFGDVFPKDSLSVKRRFKPVVFIGASDAPRLEELQPVVREHGQDTVNLLLARAGVVRECLPKAPRSALAVRRLDLAYSFGRRLIALQNGTAESDKEPMPLVDVRFLVHYLRQSIPDMESFSTDVRTFIVNEVEQASKPLDNPRTLDDFVRANQKRSALSSLLGTYFGDDEVFKTLFNE